MSDILYTEDLHHIRREFHRDPEPSWCEFTTTARILEILENCGVETIYFGADALDRDSRADLPPAEVINDWYTRAESTGIDDELLDAMADGMTGCIAVIGSGDDPVIAVRVDIDALPITESTADSHRPAIEGFRSNNDGYMHACGHDAHTTIGIGLLDRLVETQFEGTVKVLFQPSEEVAGGASAMVGAGHLDDVDHLIAIHVGLGLPTGAIVAGYSDFLAISHLSATFHGDSAHAGSRPNEGANAIHALATAIENLYGIPRHGDGATRVNVGKVSGGTKANIVADSATLLGEVRGESTALLKYMRSRAEKVIRSAAAMHGCSVDILPGGGAPSGQSDQALAAEVEAAAATIHGISSVVPAASFGASEDATYMMNHVQERSGQATYIGIGSDISGGHHTPTFDIDEDCIEIAVNLLESTIDRLLS